MSYTGIDLDYAAALMDGIDHLCSYDNLYDNDFSSNGTVYYPVKEIIGIASIVVNKMGYFNAESRYPTRWIVSSILRNDIDELNEDLGYHRFDTRFSKEEFDVDNSADVDAIIDYYMSLDNDNEFVHNIQTIISDGYATLKDLGFLCYTPQGYAKHMQREIERAKRNTLKREHWGEVGKRYKNVSVKEINKVAGYLTDYGVMNVWQIIIDNDVVLTWKSSVFPEDEISTVSFTVKEHGEYKGVPQTIVTRCRFAA